MTPQEHDTMRPDSERGGLRVIVCARTPTRAIPQREDAPMTTADYPRTAYLHVPIRISTT
jgi:hypothetical protein